VATAGASVATAGACVAVAAPPHADNKSPSTVMNENSVTIFFMALLLLFGFYFLTVNGHYFPIVYFDYREWHNKRLAQKLDIFVTKLD
jgi:hypothetical protein